MQVLDKGSVALLNHMGDDNTIVSAARVSYLGESKGNKKDAELIRYLMENKHTSPFEQVEFQFMVKCPIFIARQWHRHRTWSYNEVSRRYTSEDIDFYIPNTMYEQSTDNKQMTGSKIANSGDLMIIMMLVTSDALIAYDKLIKAGVAREQARIILPQNMYTKFYAKTDLHNLLHFIELRNHPHAQLEMREYAKALELLIKPIVPVTYSIWKELQHG